MSIFELIPKANAVCTIEVGPDIYGKLYLWHHIKNNNSTSYKHEKISNSKLSRNVELRKKMRITYSCMHCKR